MKAFTGRGLGPPTIGTDTTPEATAPKIIMGSVHEMQITLYGMLKSGHETGSSAPLAAYTVPSGSPAASHSSRAGRWQDWPGQSNEAVSE